MNKEEKYRLITKRGRAQSGIFGFFAELFIRIPFGNEKYYKVIDWYIKKRYDNN